MKIVEQEANLDGAEITALQEKARIILESSEGQQILRELNAFDALAHSDKEWVSPREGKKRGYTTNDYKKHPERFSIANFFPAVYFVEDGLLLTADTAFTHRTRLEGLIAAEMPELYDRLQKREVIVIAGDTFEARDTDIRFFAVKGNLSLQYKEVQKNVARQLARNGILLLFWDEDREWEAEQLKRPEFARCAAYLKKVEEARSRCELFEKWGNILDEFGGHAPEGPETRYKWTIISPF